MCGGCGSLRDVDWASPAVEGPGARAAVAATASALCRSVGDRTRVVAGPGGWVVSSPTGHSVVASTTTGLWDAVTSWRRGVARTGLAPLAEVAVGPGGAPHPLEQRGCRVALLLGAPAAADAAWADVVQRTDGPEMDPGGVESDLDTALTSGAGRVLLTSCSADRTPQLLRILARARYQQRCSVTAIVTRLHTARSPAPTGWVDGIDGLDGLDDEGLRSVLDGAPPAVARVVDADEVHMAAAVCWASAAIAAGGVDRDRLRVRCSDGHRPVLVDAACGTGLSVRLDPGPPVTTSSPG